MIPSEKLLRLRLIVLISEGVYWKWFRFLLKGFGVSKISSQIIAVLVHPDKNMGSPLASESFKKLQCAYEGDITKQMTAIEEMVASEYN
ncbi:uncharacterized protein LOC127149445 isoform X2 [Cucumis melo]|uniref:Uncharacterized protein LOC127149445 isoform X2 n=1 Tax=Cucumis melo TaxID=3656 RepID=A0ABM3KT38_CUCME|nr:uncharacterized protein LOC127149445 isoform X2 [Cucumis melo]